MDVNFKEALTVIYRALPVVLFRAGIFAAGGFMIIVIFGMLLFAFRVAGGAGSVVGIAVAVSALLGLAVSGLILQRFFLFRYRVAMLLLFSGRALPVPGLASAIHESANLFGNFSRWQVLNLKLRRALLLTSHLKRQISAKPPLAGAWRLFDRLAGRDISQAILALAFSRGGTDIGESACEGAALYCRYGNESRRLARQWLWFSTAGLVFLFLFLALPNWFFFMSAGAPVWIGMVLAAAIAGLLHQAFIVPFVLAGVSGSLLNEARGKTPDPALCEQFAPFFTP
jgi:hypothetical protein